MRTETKRAAELLAYYKRKLDEVERQREADDPPNVIRTIQEGAGFTDEATMTSEDSVSFIWDLHHYDGADDPQRVYEL